jgi:polyisoprenoid-binding protein YceI
MLIRTGIVAAGIAAGIIGLGTLAPVAHSETTAAKGAFAVDTVHSSVIFRIKHMDTAWFYGRFDHLSGSLSYDEADPASSALSLEVKMDSVHTGNSRRDGHLKSSDFFSARQFPVSTFVSTSFNRAGENAYELAGDLTISGVTRPITVQLAKTGSAKNNQGKELIGFETTFDIKRSDFGITFMPDGLGDDIRMIISIEAVRE